MSFNSTAMIHQLRTDFREGLKTLTGLFSLQPSIKRFFDAERVCLAQ